MERKSLVVQIQNKINKNKMIKVLILGGTGAMGKHLVDILVDKGVECVVTTRSQRMSEGLKICSW